VAIQAPAHGKGLFEFDRFHIGDIAMTTGASHAGAKMGAVIEIRKIGKLMNPHPFDRLSACPAFADRKKLFVVGSYQLVAVHADLCRRDIGRWRYLDIVVAVTAIQTEVAGMEFMAVSHRLFGTVADIGIPR